MFPTEAKLREQVDILQEENRQLRKAFAPDNVCIPAAWRLTISEQRVFRCLMTQEIVSYELLMMALYGDRPNDPPGSNTIKVIACKMRAKLKKHGVVIRTVWGIGYTLENRQAYRSHGRAAQ